MKDSIVSTEPTVSLCFIASAGRPGESRCRSAPPARRTWAPLQILAFSLMLAFIVVATPALANTDAAVFFAGCPDINVTEDTAVEGAAVVAGACTITVADGVRLMKFEQLDLETNGSLTIDGTAANKLLIIFKNSTVELTGFFRSLIITTGKGDISVKENSSLIARGLLSLHADDGDVLVKASAVAGGGLLVSTDSGGIILKEASMAAGALAAAITTLFEGDITVKDSDFSSLFLGTGIFAADQAVVIGNDFSGLVVLISGNPCTSKRNDPDSPCI